MRIFGLGQRPQQVIVSGVNSVSTPRAVNCAGFGPLPETASEDGSPGYAMGIIIDPGSRVEKMEDIARPVAR